MTRSDSFSFYRQTVLSRIPAPLNEADQQWQTDMIECAWLANLDADDATDMIRRAQQERL